MKYVEFEIEGKKVKKYYDFSNKKKMRKEALERRTSSEVLAEKIFKKHFNEKEFRVEDWFQFRRFDFYIPKIKAAIEIDGGYHNGSFQKDYDEKADKYLKEKYGIRVYRVRNEEVKNNLGNLLVFLKREHDFKVDYEIKKIAAKKEAKVAKKKSKKEKYKESLKKRRELVAKAKSLGINSYLSNKEYRSLIAIAEKSKIKKTILRKATLADHSQPKADHP